MAKSKYGKYIITELKQPKVEAAWSPPLSAAGKNKGGRVLYLDSDVAPGAFYMECVWILPRPAGTVPGGESGRRVGTEPHTHDYDEVLCFFGSNQEDYYELGGEIEFWLGGEKHIINKSCIIFIPKDVQHGPLRVLRVDRPMFSFSSGHGKTYF